MTKIYSKIIIINEKFKKQFFFSCILHDSVSHEKPEEFWNNSHLENMRADFLRCIKTYFGKLALK